MTFAKNMGGIDRIARFIIGALLVVLAITGTIGVWGWIGIILVVTAFINFCPIYSVFGIKTCKDCLSAYLKQPAALCMNAAGFLHFNERYIYKINKLNIMFSVCLDQSFDHSALRKSTQHLRGINVKS